MSSTRACLVLVAFALCATQGKADIKLGNETGDDVKFWIKSKGDWDGPHIIKGNSVYTLTGFAPGVYNLLYQARDRRVQNRGVKLREGSVYNIRVGGGGPSLYAAFYHLPPINVGVLGEDGTGASMPPENATKPDRPRLGVNCYKCDDGMHLKSVTADGPAANCLDQDGKRIRLKADDHIVAINDVTPQSYEHFLKLIQQSERVAELEVTVGRSGQRMTVGVALWSDLLSLGVNGSNRARGIYVESVDANSPALRCRQANGDGWHLERGETILEVDGLAPETFEQFVDLIQAANRTVHLLVLDTDGNEVALTTRLW